MIPHSRRSFLKSSACATTSLLVGAPHLCAKPTLLGQGGFQYRVVPNWGVLDDNSPVNNCHGIVQDKEGHLILFTDHAKNNIIVYNRDGKLVHKWGTDYPGAHGLSIVTEGDREVLFLTDLKRHMVFKTTLDGEVLEKWGWPGKSGKYEKADQYRPSWTLHKDNGEFFVLDGYGKDYIQHFDASGKQINHFGGQEGGISHWGPHGGVFDQDSLLIAMSDQQYLMRLDTSGKELGRTPLPGGNPRQIHRDGDHYYVAHLADNWPVDRNSRGFITVLDKKLKAIANIGGTPPVYNGDGALQKMQQAGDIFRHPHDLVVDKEGSIYVAQFASGKTYPIKLERV